MTTKLLRVAAALSAACVLASCSSGPQELHASLKPLTKEATTLLAQKGVTESAPIFVRIFKEESELEVWKAKDDGTGDLRYFHFKTYPICHWSGELGPKLEQGDKQAPEGFYLVSHGQMNPNSNFHLAFNLGYPNAYDRAHKRTGAHLMVHGKCRSAGCYAMTDALMEEIYALSREAFIGGQKAIPVHAFPFRMTEANMKRHAKSEWIRFWRVLKEGYDAFELTRQPPEVAVCERRYLVNAKFATPSARVQPEDACPPHIKQKPQAWAGLTDPKVADDDRRRVIARGPRLRDADFAVARGPMSSPTTTAGLPENVPASTPNPSPRMTLGFSRLGGPMEWFGIRKPKDE